MEFTREPIIETVISASEGYLLHLKHGSETYQVISLQIVSWGSLFFVRSLEQDHQFLMPLDEVAITEHKVSYAGLRLPANEKTTASKKRTPEKKAATGRLTKGTTSKNSRSAPKKEEEKADRGREVKANDKQTNEEKPSLTPPPLPKRSSSGKKPHEKSAKKEESIPVPEFIKGKKEGSLLSEEPVSPAFISQPKEGK
ncbi:MAG: hypothetical protein VXZ72_05365 [Chlamydiota bacterium]|nr:hypothetical protein [Chlamydiota bacterium]